MFPLVLKGTFPIINAESDQIHETKKRQQDGHRLQWRDRQRHQRHPDAAERAAKTSLLNTEKQHCRNGNQLEDRIGNRHCQFFYE